MESHLNTGLSNAENINPPAQIISVRAKLHVKYLGKCDQQSPWVNRSCFY